MRKASWRLAMSTFVAEVQYGNDTLLIKNMEKADLDASDFFMVSNGHRTAAPLSSKIR
jgi:hypothetical protein